MHKLLGGQNSYSPPLSSSSRFLMIISILVIRIDCETAKISRSFCLQLGLRVAIAVINAIGPSSFTCNQLFLQYLILVMVREWEHRESDCPWYTEHQRRHCYANIQEISEKNIKTARPPSLWFHPIDNWLIQDIFSNDLETIYLSFLTLYTMIQKFHPRTEITEATVKE